MKYLLNIRSNTKWALEGLLQDGVPDNEWLVMGRACPDMNQFLSDLAISRWHATIIRQGKELYLVDHSKCGTWTGHADDGTVDQSGCPKTMSHSVLISDIFAQTCVGQNNTRYNTVQGATFDRRTFETYAQDVAAFLDSLKDASTRENYASLGTKLKPGMRISFGDRANVYEYKDKGQTASESQ